MDWTTEEILFDPNGGKCSLVQSIRTISGAHPAPYSVSTSDLLLEAYLHAIWLHGNNLLE